MTAVGQHLVQFREGREPHRRVLACRLVAAGAVRDRKPPQERIRLEYRELRHAQEVRDDSKFIGFDAPAAVLKIGHGAGVQPQRACEIRGSESRGLPQPPDLAADGHLHGESMDESCENRKSLG